MRDRLWIALVLVCGFLSACADPNVAPVPFDLGGPSRSAVLGPGLRTIREQPRALILSNGTQVHLPTICAEPSPDVAIAFARSLAASVNVSAPSGPSGAGTVNASQTEVATALEGRTAGVLALRDGLSAACQAYLNGVIGQDAYALILSQYGNLLVALAGTGSNGSAAPRFTAQETALSALLVSCISQHDPTRLGAGEPNPLLTVPTCHRVLDGVIAGRLLRPIPDPGGTKRQAGLQGSTVTINVAK